MNRDIFLRFELEACFYVPCIGIECNMVTEMPTANVCHPTFTLLSMELNISLAITMKII